MAKKKNNKTQNIILVGMVVLVVITVFYINHTHQTMIDKFNESCKQCGFNSYDRTISYANGVWLIQCNDVRALDFECLGGSFQNIFNTCKNITVSCLG